MQHPNELALIRKKLNSKEDIDERTGFPGQYKMFLCGELLLSYLNRTRTKGGFAVIEVRNTKWSYIFGGAIQNLDIWKTILQTANTYLPKNAYIGRISPGFAIHAWGDNIEEDLAKALRQIQLALETIPIEIDRHGTKKFVPIRLSTQIGYLIYPDDCDYLEDFLPITRYAALTSIGVEDYEDGSTIKRFNSELAHEAEDLLELDDRLSHAIETGKIEMYFQPKLNLRTKQLIGAEALARWTDETLGIVSPMKFIPVIERSRIIFPFTKMTIEKSIAFIAENRWRFPADFKISINISQNIFNWLRVDLVEIFTAALEKYNCPASSVEIEITESAYFSKRNTPKVLSTLQQLKAIGISVAIDDFGSGYGALTLITNNIASTIKVDRELTSRILDRSIDSTFLNNMLFAANAAGINVVVEGIEEAWQENELLQQNVIYGQGYLYAAALSPAKFIQYMSTLGG